jgi:hypothetical protein
MQCDGSLSIRVEGALPRAKMMPIFVAETRPLDVLAMRVAGLNCGICIEGMRVGNFPRRLHKEHGADAHGTRRSLKILVQNAL